MRDQYPRSTVYMPADLKRKAWELVEGYPVRGVRVLRWWIEVTEEGARLAVSFEMAGRKHERSERL